MTSKSPFFFLISKVPLTLLRHLKSQFWLPPLDASWGPDFLFRIPFVPRTWSLLRMVFVLEVVSHFSRSLLKFYFPPRDFLCPSSSWFSPRGARTFKELIPPPKYPWLRSPFFLSQRCLSPFWGVLGLNSPMLLNRIGIYNSLTSLKPHD